MNIEPIKRSDDGWCCPKCNRSYGPAMPSCIPCNRKIDEQERNKEPLT